MSCQLIKRCLAAILLLIGAVTLSYGSEITVKDGETIAFLGDSITAGGAAHGNYCRLVIHGLKTKGVTAKGIYAGVPGNKSSDMLLRLDGILKQDPDHLFLACGVNDIWHGATDVRIGVFKPPHEGMGVNLDHYKIYVSEILDRCEKAGVKIILSTITPIKEDPEFKLNVTARKYNAFLYEQAKQRALPIARLHEEMFGRIAEIKADGAAAGQRNVLTSDGVHPTTVGHQVMAKGILRAMGFSDEELSALEKEWNSSPRIVVLGDRQVSAGCRTGGWVHMVLDGMNLGREMVTSKIIAQKNGTLSELVEKLANSAGDGRDKYVLLVAPLGDVQETTPIDEYRSSVTSLVDLTSKRDLKLLIVTIPMLGNDTSEMNIGRRPFNKALGEVCMERKIPLLSMGGKMAAHYERHPDTELTLGDERLNHRGGTMLAELVMAKGFGRTKSLVGLLQKWDERESYTFKYDSRVSFSVGLSDTGKNAVQEVTDRFHRLSKDKMLAFGVHMLLAGDDNANQTRLNYARRLWLSKDRDSDESEYRMAPGSAKQARAIDDYVERENIDTEEFYRRAFMVGLFSLRKENPLGRGSY